MADKELEHPKAGHEESDVNVIAISKFGIALTLTILVSVFALWGLFHYFVSRDIKSYAGYIPLPSGGPSAIKEPPQPRLQQTPRIDLREMRNAEDQILNHYSWADRNKGVVRLPIDRAMDILAERGSKSQPAAGQPAGAGSTPQPTTK
jgi:hypothetical protein